MAEAAELTSPLELAAEELGQKHSVTQRSAAPLDIIRNPKAVENWLNQARLACRKPDPDAAKAAEWVLDNDYQVSRALRLIRKDMPDAFYKRLPALADEGACGPRIYMIAHELLRATHLQLSLANAVRFVSAYQRSKPLTIAELWAFPTMVRVACIEILAAALTPMLAGQVRLGFAVSTCAGDAHSLEPTERVARSISNLAEAAAIPWEEFFERTSLVEKALREDPHDTYGRMDFETRDQYRTAVEEIAKWGSVPEIEVTREAIARSRSERSEKVGFHVGYWLIDDGRAELERQFDAKPEPRRAFKRAILARPGRFFAAGMTISAVLCAVLPAFYLAWIGAGWIGWVAALLLSQIPASILAITLVHWIVTRITEPCVLPKLDSERGIPAEFPVTVTVPVVIARQEEVDALKRQMEMHWLANTDPALQVALLADLADAPEETLPGDHAIVEALESAVEDLNERYGSRGIGPFHLLMRPRLFNPQQGCWMAWERKRGKLEQFNRLIVEGDGAPFTIRVGDRIALDATRFVLTLDADTILPSGSVAKLAGTLAHPLNRPAMTREGRLQRGYSIIQPRVEISPASGERTLFARLFTGETAIDIYSRAVSDVYQDLFGSGIFVGKGIYDLAAFHAAADGKVPENAILSHDLFEGALGRAALATDIVLYEGFPDTYRHYAQRLHRWIRGDWQLLPWLMRRVPGTNGTRIRNPVGALDRWKMFDNLRRSLVQPGLVMLAMAGWLVLPGSPWFWTALVLLAPAGQLLIDLASGLTRGRRRGATFGFRARMIDQTGRWLLVIVFMLHEALLSLHAIVVTLWRRYVSKRNLLEWTSAAHVAAHAGGEPRRFALWRQMAPAPLLAIAIAAAVYLFRPAAIAPALFLILPWALAPEIARFIELPRRRAGPTEGKLDIPYLRQLARRTWLYFETFAGPGDNWLPPDNYQGPPHEEIAHRTSPTNIAMLILSTASAWDLGFVGRVELAARTRNVLDSLGQLERHRGHFLNWYETHHLRPLEPRYVSTVDSGNLAAALVSYAHCLRDAARENALENQRWAGLQDLFALVAEHAGELDDSEEFRARVGRMGEDASRQGDDAADAQILLHRLLSDDLPALEAEGAHIMQRAANDRAEQVRDLNIWIERLRHHIHDMARDTATVPTIGSELIALAHETERLAWEMDFTWLYDKERRLFFIGHNVSTAETDVHHYDLLASEARIASFFAIAKKDVAVEHWFHLGRPITRADGNVALVSWNGSMFEYLMPRLLMPSGPDTLLGESEHTAVAVHRRYGQSSSTPWGISESAYAARDPEHRFRYRAFGVPGLGLRRGLAQDLVIAPYASALALAHDPVAAQANLKRLESLGAGGRYGLWEAIDFTPHRAPASDGIFTPVNAFMAHHQGMILCAIGNLLTGDVLVDRFTRDPQIQLTTLLLSERIPHELPAEIERLETVTIDDAAGANTQIRYNWTPAETSFPQTHLLGNGRLSSRISSSGGGGLFWNGQALTRFVPDATRDAEGFWFYLRDEHSERVWSATRQPTGVAPAEESITFRSHAAEFQRRDSQINTRLEVTVGASDDIELRRLLITNESSRRRSLRLTSYAEIALAPPLEDERHLAFSKMFVRSDFLAEPGALLFTRRPRRPEDTPPVLLQTVIGADGIVPDVSFECDRRLFLGRNRTAHAPLGATRSLSGTQGWTLDPAACFQLRFDLEPGETKELCFVTIAAASRSSALELLERHATLSAIRWLTDDAEREVSRAIHRARIAPDLLPDVQALGSLMVYPHSALRAERATIRGNALGQQNLWGLALSGDLPILLLKGELEENELLDLVIGAHQLWRRAGLQVDIVILQTLGSAYIEPVRDALVSLLQEVGATEMLGRNGGIHLVFADQIGSGHVRLLEAMAWAVLDGSNGPLADQIARAMPHRLEPPPILPSLEFEPEPQRPPARPDDLLFDNGYGGFTADGREYLIHLEPGNTTPAPWVNVLANDAFGTLVTESGGGFTWSVNSGEYRLTPWTNDPVADRQTEILYLRDEETSQVWSVTPDPAGRDMTCQVRHGAGFTEWRQASRGIEQRMTVTVARDAPVKLIRLTLRNLGRRDRRITATYYAEWLLGSLPGIARRHVHCRFDPDAQAIVATNPWNADFAGRSAFLTASEHAHGFATDRQEFIGREGNLARPAALGRWGLDNSEVAGADACAAYQVHLDLARGESREILFVLGEAETEQEALALARDWRSVGRGVAAEAENTAYWDDLLAAVEVETPDPALDILANRWLLYQSLSSRILARTGFYQASGAIGFRDQLQDVLAFLHADPERVRDHILTCAAHQFEEGDVLHWWHPPAGRGVRTRITDDLLWLPYATAHYVNATGDTSILEEEVRFLTAPPLADNEHDRYAMYDAGGVPRSLIEHCERALERVELGSHMLPLIGTGDWNDGMDRVGDKGRGESVWLAWFASVCAASLAHCERLLGRIPESRHWAERAATWRRNAEHSGWDGEWYRRAYDDEGTPLGSQENDECWIDSISQSWSVFAGGASTRSRTALQAALRELVDEEAGIARLLWPPFDKSAHDPGYIMAYPPGIRENGGQYSHAAAWLGLALARTGQGNHAHRIFTMLNPIEHARERQSADIYRTEPYSVAADIGSVGRHRGMGGWSWYTGAAAWTWRLAVEGILGLTLRDGRIHISPSLPEGWDGYEATLRRGGGTIRIKLTREGPLHGRARTHLIVDGEPFDGELIAFPPSGECREVEARIGDAPDTVSKPGHAGVKDKAT
ncbi:GH36-type glycosyl hydrolase domain-containing protein [Qipengyuania sp.]|uniref:GH36-type glycosyl hydrolase domain-containing protein n=1 Tax=Qipengyuania sp. TaxID=2004515 RepID=UPI003BAD611E